MSIIAIEFLESKMIKMNDTDIIDMMEWIVSNFNDSYEMRCKPDDDKIYFVGESNLFPEMPDGSMYKILPKTKRLKPLFQQL